MDKRQSKTNCECLISYFTEWVTRTATPKPSKKNIIEFINKMASNKRKFQKSGKIKTSLIQNHTTKGVIVKKDKRPPVHHHDHDNLPPAIFHQGSQRDENSESAAGEHFLKLFFLALFNFYSFTYTFFFNAKK